MVIATSNALVPKSGGLMLGCIEAANFVRFLAIYEIYNSTYSETLVRLKKKAHILTNQIIVKVPYLKA